MALFLCGLGGVDGQKNVIEKRRMSDDYFRYPSTNKRIQSAAMGGRSGFASRQPYGAGSDAANRLQAMLRTWWSQTKGFLA